VRGLYVLADTGLVPVGRLAERVEQALRGGAALIQYRNKQPLSRPRLDELARIRELCRLHRIPLIVNDDVALALDIGADGVHLGRDDADIAEARRRLGAGSVIGASCYNDLPRALAAQARGADYVAFGSFFASSTKPEATRVDAAILLRARGRLDLPLVAIGGITPDNGAGLIAAGADALAVAGGVIARADAEARARAYARLFADAAEKAEASKGEDPEGVHIEGPSTVRHSRESGNPGG
jgi:thiamine-phosphate pyrophosphorylase